MTVPYFDMLNIYFVLKKMFKILVYTLYIIMLDKLSLIQKKTTTYQRERSKIIVMHHFSESDEFVLIFWISYELL